MNKKLDLLVKSKSKELLHLMSETDLNCIYVSPDNFTEERVSSDEFIATVKVDGKEKILKVKLDDTIPVGEVHCHRTTMQYLGGITAYSYKIDNKNLEFTFRDKIYSSDKAEQLNVSLKLMDNYAFTSPRISTPPEPVPLSKEVLDKIKQFLPKYIFNDNYKFIFAIKNNYFKNTTKEYIFFECSVKKIAKQGDESNYIEIDDNTKINAKFESIGRTNQYFTIDGQLEEELLKKIKYDWSELGVGGLNQQIKQIIDQVFLPRRMPKKDYKKYGGKLNKGVLLYGPPGTGKTLIASKIGEMFTKKQNIKIINGPELKSKWVGESESNLRAVFQDAEKEWAQKKENSSLHIIIIDEIDGLIPKRTVGTDGGASVNNGLTTTLLTKMDGINTPNNFIVFGLTNRKDTLDDAILRPGRLGLHIKIGLPDEPGRKQILTIHTKDLNKNKLLAEDVDLDYLAKETENWSGAELADLVTKARNYAIANNFDFDEENNKVHYKKDGKLAVVTMEHFKAALKYINPQHKGNLEKLRELVKNPFNLHNEKLKKLFSKAKSDIKGLDSTKFCSLAIFGDAGVGKTSLAAKIALQTKAKCIEIIQAKDLCMKSDKEKFYIIDSAFERASKSKDSVIILDDIESIVGLSNKGIFSPHLKTYIENKMNSMERQDDNKLMLITTCRSQENFNALFGSNSYNRKLVIDKINNVTDLVSLFRSLGIKVNNIGQLSKLKAFSAKDWLYKAKRYMTVEGIQKDKEIDLSDFINKSNGIDPDGGDSQYQNRRNNSGKETTQEEIELMEELVKKLQSNVKP